MQICVNVKCKLSFNYFILLLTRGSEMPKRRVAQASIRLATVVTKNKERNVRSPS